MAHHLQATPDQVLSVVGGFAGGLLVGLGWWFAWWLTGGRTTRRIDADVRALERSQR